MYADIIVDITHEKLDKVFQYRIPSHLEGMLKVGTEVVVPFGKGNKEIKGVKYPMDERVLIAEVLEELKEEKQEKDQNKKVLNKSRAVKSG